MVCFHMTMLSELTNEVKNYFRKSTFHFLKMEEGVERHLVGWSFCFGGEVAPALFIDHPLTPILIVPHSLLYNLRVDNILQLHHSRPGCRLIDPA